jgi:iron complex outermembrane receptor protein
VDRLTNFISADSQTIDSYVALDVRLAWRPAPNVELSLIGRNLLDASHPEFLSELSDIPLIDVERSVLARIEWRF